MRLIFRFQEVTEIVRDGLQELEKKSSDAQRTAHRDAEKRNGKDLFIIHQCVDTNDFKKIVSSNTVKEAWDTLEKAHGGADKLKKVTLYILRRQYELLQMNKGESVAKYVTKLLTITNQMKTNVEQLATLMIVEKVMKTLTSTLDHIMVANKKGIQCYNFQK